MSGRFPNLVFVSCAVQALYWSSERELEDEDVPTTLESAMVKLLTQAEKVVGVMCVSKVFGYLSSSK